MMLLSFIFNQKWIQDFVEWLIRLLPMGDLLLVARILLWSIVLYILIKLYKEIKKK